MWCQSEFGEEVSELSYAKRCRVLQARKTPRDKLMSKHFATCGYVTRIIVDVVLILSLASFSTWDYLFNVFLHR